MKSALPAPCLTIETERYARCIAASKRARWDIDSDVIRGRTFDFARKFLPDGLSRVDRLAFLTDGERRFLSQVQGRTYAALFGVIERYIGAKVLELTAQHSLGDQVALEALVRFCDEELKHQELFRRLGALMDDLLPPGWACVANADEVARAVLSRSDWAVLALTLHIERFTLRHYQESISSDQELCGLFQDVFRFHWMEESQHAVVDELEWLRVDAAASPEERDRGVDDLIELVHAIDGILQAQAASDATYFSRTCGRELSQRDLDALEAEVLAAYRWQYIGSGVAGRFQELLLERIDGDQTRRVLQAVAPFMK